MLICSSENDGDFASGLPLAAWSWSRGIGGFLAAAQPRFALPANSKAKQTETRRSCLRLQAAIACKLNVGSLSSLSEFYVPWLNQGLKKKLSALDSVCPTTIMVEEPKEAASEGSDMTQLVRKWSFCFLSPWETICNLVLEGRHCIPCMQNLKTSVVMFSCAKIVLVSAFLFFSLFSFI